MSEWDESDAQLELRLRTWAIPVALASAFFLVWAVPSLVRIFLSMWVHELGHATTAWMCGYLAFPGPWLTPTASRQSLLFELLVLGALGFGVFRAFRQERPGLARALIAVAALQLFCAALLGPARWASRTDFDRIPFGMNEGAGLSDPSVLSEGFGWSANMLVNRYVALGCVCLAVLASVWLLGVVRARRAVSASTA